MMNRVWKDPDAVLNYGHDWADGGDNDGSATDSGWLQGDTISDSSWTVSTITGDAAPLVEDSDSNDTTVTTIVLSGGSENCTYIATNHITTSAGYEDDRSILVRITEK